MTAWSFVETFHTRELAATSVNPDAWESAQALTRALDRLHRADLDTLLPLLESESMALAHAGGDPSEEDWSTFRPLRLDRAEDWSDWLAWLLLRAPPGRLVATLLGGTEPVLRVERELSTSAVDHRKFRADLVAEFADRRFVHIEVKVGDRAVDKTVDTAERLEQDHGGAWQHVLLLPDGDRWLWSETLANAAPRIRVRTWSELAAALRADLRRRRGGPTWTAFARTFCGAVEQSLLGFSSLAELRLGRPGSAKLFLAVLERSRSEEFSP